MTDWAWFLAGFGVAATMGGVALLLFARWVRQRLAVQRERPPETYVVEDERFRDPDRIAALLRLHGWVVMDVRRETTDRSPVGMVLGHRTELRLERWDSVRADEERAATWATMQQPEWEREFLRERARMHAEILNGLRLPPDMLRTHVDATFPDDMVTGTDTPNTDGSARG